MKCVSAIVLRRPVVIVRIMYLRMAKRFLLETDKRLVFKAAINLGWGGARSVMRFKSGLKRGEYFPPFLYISVLNSCNLRCQGCWVDVAAKSEKIPAEDLHRLLREAREAGNTFFGILGGEPFMYKGLLDILEQHPDCYFQIFTNGQFITDELAAQMRRMGNVTPLVSIEGTEIISDQRRGKENVLSKSMAGLKRCIDHKLLTGVATSLCQTNFDDLLREEWLDRLIEMGAMYAWYHTYRPVGPQPNEQLCLTPAQQLKTRKFVVEMRVKKPIILIDAYYQDDGQALCPAATGISHHISPWGGIEPCPIIQFAKENIRDKRHIRDVFTQSAYLSDFRKMTSETTRGCIVLERPDLVKEFVEKHGAPDGTARKTALAELAAMQPRPSQASQVEQVPEKSLAYKLAKKWFFRDFGAYDRLKN